MEATVFDKINAYLTKQLTDVQRADFDEELAADPHLKELTVRMLLLRKITQRNRVRAKILTIHEAKMNEWRLHNDERATPAPAVTAPSGPETVSEEPEVVLEERSKPGGWRYVAGILFLLVGVAAACFWYLATSPMTVREKGVSKTNFTELDSLQLIYFDKYHDGLSAHKNKNFLAANAHFQDIIYFQDLPVYYTDAARFFQVEATARQQPNKAHKLYDKIFSKKSFGYPYTNKDKLQLWCKIQWARLHGWND